MQLGNALDTLFKKHDFEVNSTKLSIRDKSSRQIVTGIVVNEKPNVPREFARDLRAMIYSWEKHGLEAAEKHWKTHHDKRNRPPWSNPRFSWVLRGKLEHLGAVKGKGDQVYLKLAKRVLKLDPNFKLDPTAASAARSGEVQVFTEGKTDRLHLQAALESFQKRGRYSDLHLSFKENSRGDGGENLLALCESLSSTQQKHLTICIFDRDNPKLTKKVKGSATDYRDWTNNVYSIAIPKPDFRESEEVCIELYYEDADLKKEDLQGRRIFTKDEFENDLGKHNENTALVKVNPKANQIVVEKVLNTDRGENVAMSKNDFAQNIFNKNGLFNAPNFESFGKIFDIINVIYRSYQT